jgi:hypothetical protein
LAHRKELLRSRQDARRRQDAGRIRMQDSDSSRVPRVLVERSGLASGTKRAGA